MEFILDLTKDELTILKYVIPHNSWGDPLKDTYELGKDEPEEPYKVLATLRQKVMALDYAPHDPLTCHVEPCDECAKVFT